MLQQKITFKKFQHHSIYGNKLEFVYNGGVFDAHGYLYDKDHFTNGDNTEIRNQMGELIWEQGETIIDTGNGWILYEVSTDNLDEKELQEAIKSNRLSPDDEKKLCKLNDGNYKYFT